MAEFKLQGNIISFEPCLGLFEVAYPLGAAVAALKGSFMVFKCKLVQPCPEYTAAVDGVSQVVEHRLPRVEIQSMACVDESKFLAVDKDGNYIDEDLAEAYTVVKGALQAGLHTSCECAQAISPEKTYRKFDEDAVTAGSPAAFYTVLAWDADVAEGRYTPIRQGAKIILWADSCPIQGQFPLAEEEVTKPLPEA